MRYHFFSKNEKLNLSYEQNFLQQFVSLAKELEIDEKSLSTSYESQKKFIESVEKLLAQAMENITPKNQKEFITDTNDDNEVKDMDITPDSHQPTSTDSTTNNNSTSATSTTTSPNIGDNPFILRPLLSSSTEHEKAHHQHEEQTKTALDPNNKK